MRCQVIYLWITFGTAPLCSVPFFFLSSLESCHSVIADATLCHPEFGLTSCEPSGRSISILACSRVCWRWEWLIKQVWASTPILLHAKQELSNSCREESWWQYSKHITINLCTEPGPSHKDNELLFPHYWHSCIHQRWSFQCSSPFERLWHHWHFLFEFCIIMGRNCSQFVSDQGKQSIEKQSGFTLQVLCVYNLKAFV